MAADKDEINVALTQNRVPRPALMYVPYRILSYLKNYYEYFLFFWGLGLESHHYNTTTFLTRDTFQSFYDMHMPHSNGILYAEIGFSLGGLESKKRVLHDAFLDWFGKNGMSRRSDHLFSAGSW
jgi:hypothetical protein